MTMQENEDEAGDDDPSAEGELTSEDYRKLQKLVDEQEKAVEAGKHFPLKGAFHCSSSMAA